MHALNHYGWVCDILPPLTPFIGNIRPKMWCHMMMIYKVLLKCWNLIRFPLIIHTTRFKHKPTRFTTDHVWKAGGMRKIIFFRPNLIGSFICEQKVFIYTKIFSIFFVWDIHLSLCFERFKYEEWFLEWVFFVIRAALVAWKLCSI